MRRIKASGLTKGYEMNITELETKWNSTADEHNQWSELGLDEIIDFAQKVAYGEFVRGTETDKTLSWRNGDVGYITKSNRIVGRFVGRNPDTHSLVFVNDDNEYRAYHSCQVEQET